jgi:glycosyltransferase involved in cell wall biosynthesis
MRLMDPTDRGPKLSVVIPVFNERATIEELVRRVLAVEIEKEIVIVDDGSTDGTRDLLKMIASSSTASAPGSEPPQKDRKRQCAEIRVLFQDKNHGKGAALRRGLREASGEILLVQDADLEYDPQDYFALLAPIESGRADVVFGSRFLGGSHRVLFFWHSIANHYLTLLSNMFSNLNLTDVWTCYKVFRREVIAGITLHEDRFGFEPEITAKVAKQRWRVFEVPITYNGRTYAQGKKITWRDGLKAIFCVVRYSFFDSGRKQRRNELCPASPSLRWRRHQLRKPLNL